MYNKIKLQRERKSLSQLELAKKSGVSRVHISRLENNRMDTTVETLSKLAKALGCEAKDLI